MKRFGAALLIIGALSVSIASGERDKRDDRRSFAFGFSGAFGPARGFGGPSGFFPFFAAPPELRTALFVDRFLFRRHGPAGFAPGRFFSGHPRGPHWFFGRSGVLGGGVWPGLYTSRSFVDLWKDREPAPRSPNALRSSILLKPGMSEAEVMQKLGSPLQRVELEGRQVWTYSGYSLLFEDGELLEIR